MIIRNWCAGCMVRLVPGENGFDSRARNGRFFVNLSLFSEMAEILQDSLVAVNFLTVSQM